MSGVRVLVGIRKGAFILTADGTRDKWPAHRPYWAPGAVGMYLHTIMQDPTNAQRLYVAISAPGTFRSDGAGDHRHEVSVNLPTLGGHLKSGAVSIDHRNVSRVSGMIPEPYAR